jgi:integrase
MATTTNRLTAVGIKNLKKKGLHADGGGLYLRITDSGTKGWIFRFARDGRTRDMGLGTCADITLASAREIAEECRKRLKQGLDPIEARNKAAREQNGSANSVTFREAVDRYISAHEPSWKNAKHRQQWRNTLESYANPIIGEMDVAAIATEDMLRVLEPIWRTKPETAVRVRGRIENVLDWCRARKLRDGANPALWRGHLKHLLPARKKKGNVRHHPAMPWRDIPAFMALLRTNSAISARALEFTILTAARTSESILATRNEFDLDESIWHVPAKRMKASVEHRVPLSGRARDIVAGLPQIEGTAYVFPGGRPARPLSSMAMLELLRGLRPGLTVHGFRSTFRDWAAEETNVASEVVEMALAHTIENEVERAYRRGDLFQKRRSLMDAWAAYCGSEDQAICLSKKEEDDDDAGFAPCGCA